MSDWKLDQTRAAQDDILDIWQYIAADSIETADRFTDEIVEAFERLRDYPRRGRPVDDLSAGMRALSYAGYLLLYRVEEDEHIVRLMRVLHGKRDLRAILHGS